MGDVIPSLRTLLSIAKPNHKEGKEGRVGVEGGGGGGRRQCLKGR